MSNRGRMSNRGKSTTSRIVSRKINNAFKTEHGHVVKCRTYDPPTYKSNPMINFKQRFEMELTSVTTSSAYFKLSDVFANPLFADYKITTMTAWADQANEANLFYDLKMSFIRNGETILARDAGGKNHYPVVRIKPPQDDWFVLGASDEPVIQFDSKEQTKILFDMSIKARVNLPQQVVTLTPSIPPVVKHSFAIQELSKDVDNVKLDDNVTWV